MQVLGCKRGTSSIYWVYQSVPTRKVYIQICNCSLCNVAIGRESEAASEAVYQKAQYSKCQDSVDISSSTERVSYVPTMVGSANTVIAVVRLDKGHTYGHINTKLVIAVSKGRYE
jgi:hypothetical protein